MRASSIPLLWIGKLLRFAARLRGGGSAFPGLVVEKLQPDFAVAPLQGMAYGVVVVTGTNGKTTTAKLLTEILRGQGLRVFTNSSGSNFMRGIISEMIASFSAFGAFPYDVAVLELDEAHAVPFVEAVAPRHCLLLNIYADQVDRFHSLEYVADLLSKVAAATTGSVVLNREDPLLRQLASELPAGTDVRYFGVGPGVDTAVIGAAPWEALDAEVLLTGYDAPVARFDASGAEVSTNLQLPGVYNAMNAAAAIATARSILGPKYDITAALDSIARVNAAPGRGERFDLDNGTVELVLVKNTAGFQFGLGAYDLDASPILIGINNAAADGKDPSWVGEVDFADLSVSGVEIVTGTQASLVAEVLERQGITVARTTPQLATAISDFLALESAATKYIFSNYTAMRQVRELLSAARATRSAP